MFSENNKLSNTGIRKLILSNSLGPIFLFSCYFTSVYDILTGIILISVIYLFSTLYLTLSFRLTDNHSLCSRLLKIKVVIKSFFIAVFLILLLLKHIRENLLPGTNTIFVSFAIILTAYMISRQSIEIRGRLCELLYLFILIPILIALIYEWCTIDYRNIGEILSASLLPTYPLTFSNLLKLFLTALFSFIVLSPWGYLLTAEPFFHDKKETLSCLRTVSFWLYLFFLLQFLAASLTYQLSPVLSVVISLILSISTSLHCGIRHVTPHFYTIAVFLFTVIMLLGNSSDSRIVDGMELEDRSFVLSMIISSSEGELTFTCELADFSSDPETISSEYVTLSDLNSYALAGGKPLDFSHIQAIVLEQSVDNLSDEQLYEMADSWLIPDKTLIFREKDFPETYKHLTTQLDHISLGEVLHTLAKNQELTNQLTLRSLRF